MTQARVHHHRTVKQINEDTNNKDETKESHAMWYTLLPPLWGMRDRDWVGTGECSPGNGKYHRTSPRHLYKFQLLEKKKTCGAVIETLNVLLRNNGNVEDTQNY